MHKQKLDARSKINKARANHDKELFLSYETIEFRELEEICNLTSLQKISITSCQLLTIPPEISQLSSLTELVLATNDLDERSIQLGGLTSLKVLNLANNKITTLDDSSIPSNISELVLHSNPILSFPFKTANLLRDSLQVLKLSSCKLETFPESIFLLPNLVELNLGNNLFTSLPFNKESCFPSLQLLDLSINKIQVFPYVDCPKTVGEIFPKIKQLILYSNKLSSLHKDFNTMQSLSVLDLQDNKLKKIDALMGLSALKVLNLALNEIETLPEDFGNSLPALEKLSIPYNNIETLPESFSLLVGLKVLELIGNKIYEIPTQLKEIKYERQKIIDENVANMVIPNLYISNFVFPKNKHSLRKLNITHIVTVIRANPLYPDDFTYMMVPVDDSPNENLLHHFPATYEFISKALENGVGVLVHCSAGISRSASVVTAFLMRHKGIPFEPALQLLKKARPSVNPNTGFRLQLHQYEAQLKIKQSNCKVQ